ncbi:hypothetical protein [Candidatus Mancarchaeum acidiphilum]|nr:hypothetical protein [Candidatus Mancarchaeum acidiphilum]
MEKDHDEEEHCLICGHKMVHVQACHLRCPNCGAVMDCSDKGVIW